MSPELALVDPELRADAIARLPRVRPYEFLDRRRDPVPEPPWFFAEAPVAYEPPRPSVAVAAAAYLATAILRTCAFNAVVFVAVAAIVLLVNLFA